MHIPISSTYVCCFLYHYYMILIIMGFTYQNYVIRVKVFSKYYSSYPKLSIFLVQIAYILTKDNSLLSSMLQCSESFVLALMQK